MNRKGLYFTLMVGLTALLSIVQCFAQTAVLRPAEPKIELSEPLDCNSPAHWDGDTLYVFTSAPQPHRNEGPDQFHLGKEIWGTYDNDKGFNGGRWIECTWKNDDGVLYGWYHNEPDGICPGIRITAPRIGAARSTDNGERWIDLGIVLEARPGTMNCHGKNGAFGGGNGDMCVMLDKKREFAYIYFDAYAGDVTEQGVSVARMRWKDRDKPVGKVKKYYKDGWTEPGVGGRLTPFLMAKVNWNRASARSFWGPAIHWNTYLKKYVMLLNLYDASGPNWSQKGVHISYNKDIADPNGWSEPKLLCKPDRYYPSVIGVNAKAKETDKLCGRVGRFYVHGVSTEEIVFFREGDDATKLPPIYKPGEGPAKW
jgi:hypothetical protein